MQKAMRNSFYTIESTEDRYYSSFAEIYSVSFPIFEQRDEAQQREAFGDERYHLSAIVEGDEVVSFIAYWDFESYVYIEHLAVNPTHRGQSIGSNTLLAFADYIDKTIVLEIDPPVDEISKKRLRFYQNLGYMTNPYPHFHPAYRPAEFTPHQLLVMSNPRGLSKSEYELFSNQLTKIVMRA